MNCFNSLQTGKCSQREFVGPCPKRLPCFNSLQTGKCSQSHYIEVDYTGCLYSFNSLQTGKCSQSPFMNSAKTFQSFGVSIPFKRESVAKGCRC